MIFSTRVLVDVVGDLTHFGHTNAFRQAREFGSQVVAGVHPDEEIIKHKHCKPVFTHSERCELIRNIRYVDEVIEDLRYDFNLADLDNYHLDINVHGNEITFDGNGKPLYQDIQRAGRYRQFPRTVGTCTTDVMEKILMVYSSAENGSSADMALGFSPAGGHSYSLSRNHMSPEALCCRPVIFDEPNLFLEFPKLLETYQKLFKSAEHNYLAKVIDSDDPFLMHDQFVSVITVPQTGSPTITCSPSFHSGSLVYVQGNFDIFSIGHLRFLQEASKLGDSLLVGITPDLAVKGHKGPGYPLNNAYQRALTLLSYKCVTGVVLLPGTKCHRIDPHFLDRFGVATVCVGKIAYERGSLSNGDKRFQQDTFEVPKAMGILKIIDSGSMVTTSVVMDRILQQKQKYIERNAKKLKKGILSVQ